MEDLGAAMSGREGILMLGGGNPGHIPEVQQFFRERMQRILDDPVEFAHVIGDYDPPQGKTQFIEALAGLFRREYGWEIDAGNIALTAGSQCGFFLLFNMFGGEYESGVTKKIMLPVTPEYIGYADVGLADNLFTAYRPVIETFDDHTFKYHVDFDALRITDEIGAVCVSRPTNPTGNVLPDAELNRLLELTLARDIPLIVDNAYGLPFPGILFTDVSLMWDVNTVLCLSLSKLGLPGARTGIILGPEQVIRSLTNMNAVVNLSLGSFGPALALDLVASGEITRISRSIIRPYYERKALRTMELLKAALDGVEFYIHRPEGAIFLWLWLPGLPVTCEELYQRLKRKGVLVIPGHHFFPGLDDDWRHRHECVRITYSMQDEVVERGIELIAAEIKAIFSGREK